jgi:hypothetical protein
MERGMEMEKLRDAQSVYLFNANRDKPDDILPTCDVEFAALLQLPRTRRLSAPLYMRLEGLVQRHDTLWRGTSPLYAS